MIHHDDGQARFLLGDCREVMRGLDTNSVDAIVTDPPYGLEFMGKEWDKLGRKQALRGATSGLPTGPGSGRGTSPTAGRPGFDLSSEAQRAMQEWHREWATEALRVAKPGAHIVAFGGTRTSHRLVCAIEDAGWEIRDSLMWLFGSGFPKSLNLGNGWGTALKPGYEPIVLARKPLTGTVAGNVTEWGTGAINVDGCRIGTDDVRVFGRQDGTGDVSQWRTGNKGVVTGSASGRWPANVVLDEEAAAMLDEAVGERPSASSRSRPPFSPTSYGMGVDDIGIRSDQYAGETGGPSRFFYTSKASRSEREQGLDGMSPVRRSDGREKDTENPRLRTNERRNHHPTVKPLDLMRWLCRLVTPSGGVILDPFLGSGTTAVAAKAEGFRVVGIEMEAEYLEIATRRAAQMGMAL